MTNFYNLYFYQILLMRSSGETYRAHESDKKCMPDLVGRPEGTRPLARPKRILKDNIKIYFKEIMCRGG
jgi:hypothetical protein